MIVRWLPRRRLRAWSTLAAFALSAFASTSLWPGSGLAASRLALSASPRSVEVADVVTLGLRGAGKRTCRVVVTADRRSSRVWVRRRIHRQLALSIGASTKPGGYLVEATCGRRRAAARFVVHDPKGPDFALALAPARTTANQRRAGTRIYSVTASNLAPWVATSARLCVRVAGGGARITAARFPGSRKSNAGACAILATVPGGEARGFEFRIHSAKKLTTHRPVRVTATVSGGNSNGELRAWKVGSDIRTAKAAANVEVDANAERARAMPRATIAPSPAIAAQASSAPPASCTSAAKIGVAFVADDSGSMLASDPGELRGQAISVGLDQLPNGSLAGATRFADQSSELFPVTEVTPTTRPALKAADSSLQSNGNTDYEQAFEGAQAQLAKMGAADRKAVIFLSDGVPSYSDYTADQAIASAGTPIFTIGFGTADQGILADIAARSGGQAFAAGSAGDLQSIYARIVGALTCSSPTLSTAVDVAPGEVQSIPFAVAPDDGEFRALATWSGGHLTVSAVRPDASVMSATATRYGEQFSDNPTYALLIGTNPQVGGWRLQIASDAGNSGTVHVSIDVFKKGLPALAPTPPLNTKTQGRQLDPCFELYRGGKRATKKIFGGRQTDYDRTNSLFDVCSGFGSPEDLVWSLGMKCAFVSAATVLAGGKLADPALVAFDDACGATSTLSSLASGDWAGVAGSEACNTFGDLFSGGVGIIAAGAALETGPGAVFAGDRVFRFFDAGFKIACGGLFSGGAVALGTKLEADHETAIARDVSSNGKCLRFTERLGWASWSAATCSI